MNLTEVRVAFDNAGGVTIVAPDYAHSYNDGKQPAEDVQTLLDGGDIILWDGNDEELLAALDEDEMDRYERVYTVAEVAESLKSGNVEIDEDDVSVDGRRLSGYSESQFFRLLKSAMEGGKMKRWIPKLGETVRLAGSDELPAWEGRVTQVSKADCRPGTVYLDIAGHGHTLASREEITILAGAQ